jgi:hypothetical protein
MHLISTHTKKGTENRDPLYGVFTCLNSLFCSSFLRTYIFPLNSLVLFICFKDIYFPLKWEQVQLFGVAKHKEKKNSITLTEILELATSLMTLGQWLFGGMAGHNLFYK